MSSGKPKRKKRERKVPQGTEEQRQSRLALARPKLRTIDREKIKKIIASAITKYANEKVKPDSNEPMKMNIDDIPMNLRIKKGKKIGITAVRNKFEQLDFNDEDILSLLSIVLQRSQIKALNLVKPLTNEDKLPKSVYAEMDRYIRQNATMVEELQSENTPLGELIKIVLTEPVDEIKKDVRKLGLSPMPLDAPADAPADAPEGKEPKQGKEAEPKGKEPKQGKIVEGQRIEDVVKDLPSVIELMNEFKGRHGNAVGSIRKGTGKKWSKAFNKLDDYIKEGKETREGYTTWYTGTPQGDLLVRLARLYNSKDYTFDSVLKILEDMNLTDKFASPEDIEEFKEKIALKPEPETETETDDDEPKKEKEGIDVEVEVPVKPKGGGMKTISKKKPKEDVVEIERETRSERQVRMLTEEEKDVVRRIIDTINKDPAFKERFRQGALNAQRKMIQLEPDIARAVTPEQLNQIANTYHLRFLLNTYLKRQTMPQELAEQVARYITGREPNQLRIEGSKLQPQSLIPDESGVDEYLNLFSSTNDPDDLWGSVIGELSESEEEPSITTKGGKKPSIFARPPPFAPSAPTAPTAPSGVATKKIKVPEDWSENKQAKGTLRPKFISPSVNVLQPSEQDIQADFDEWAIFDFVQPVNNYGAEGNNENNPLKRMARVEEETRYRNAGIDLDPSLASVYTNREVNTSQEAMAMNMLPPLMPDTSSQPRQVYDVSEYEVKSYDVNNDRTQIEYQSPYDNMTPIVLTNDEIRRSVLYGRVP